MQPCHHTCPSYSGDGERSGVPGQLPGLAQGLGLQLREGLRCIPSPSGTGPPAAAAPAAAACLAAHSCSTAAASSGL